MAFEAGKRPESGMEVTGVIELIAEGLFGISLGEVRRLKETIKQTNGRIELFVHPHSERQTAGREWSESERARLEEYETRLDEHVRNNDTVPTIVMEVFFYIPSTRERLHQLSPNKEFYFIPTRFEEDMGESGLPSPTPVFRYEAGQRTLEGSWDQLRHVFKYLSVREITLGGMYLKRDATQPDATGPDAYTHCVADTWLMLQFDFDVQISPLTFPVSGSELR